MRALLINKYLYPKGGDAISTLTTGALLKTKGWEVVFWGMDHPTNPDYPYKDYFVSHKDFNAPANLADKIRLSFNILYSFEAKRKIEALLDQIHPDIVHVNNFAHQISPSILDAFKRRRIPVVMTMRDYKMVCASYSMLSKGRICERCKYGKYYHCLTEKCAKDSATKSLVNTVEMYLHHRLLHIYDTIHTFISPSRFLMDKVREMGFPGRVTCLPNFVNVDSITPSYGHQEESIVFVGRLSHEKGVGTLIDAVKGLNVSLKLVGDGTLMEPLSQKVRSEGLRNVEFLGFRTSVELQGIVRKSLFAVLPSEWYENNPRSVIEAFALGKPAVGARIGGIPELVMDGHTGYTFEPWNVGDLREKIMLMLDSRGGIEAMGRNARSYVERALNPEIHYERLMEIYSTAIRDTRGG